MNAQSAVSKFLISYPILLDSESWVQISESKGYKSHLVQQRLVIGGFTGVHVDPAPHCSGVVLRPHVVCPVSDVPRIKAHSTAAKGETICPLPAAAPPCLQ